MACYHPRPAFEVIDLYTGEVFIRIWHPKKGDHVKRAFQIPCQQCSGCRSDYSRSWALRCEHEAMFHRENCFLTLTVAPKFLDAIFPNGSLKYEPFQKFIRSLRKALVKPIRFFMCGEYGPQLDRPHYHAVIFGWFPDSLDRIFYKDTPVGPLWISKLVESIWPFGFNTVAAFSRDTAAYVAGYMQKKIKGKMAAKWYGGRMPEFSRMSNGGGVHDGKKFHGIGVQFYDKFKRDVYSGRDGITLPGGYVAKTPRYYDKLHAEYHPQHMERLKLKRMEPDPIRDRESTPERLAVREEVHKSKLRNKKRDL